MPSKILVIIDFFGCIIGIASFFQPKVDNLAVLMANEFNSKSSINLISENPLFESKDLKFT